MDAVEQPNELIRRAAAGERLKFLCFWGHTPAADGSVTKACFSQWFEAAFEIDGVSYATAEHWMMAEKARLFSDAKALEKIVKATHPKQAKELGRGVMNFDDAVWRRERFGIVVRGNLAKFTYPWFGFLEPRMDTDGREHPVKTSALDRSAGQCPALPVGPSVGGDA